MKKALVEEMEKFLISEKEKIEKDLRTVVDTSSAGEESTGDLKVSFPDYGDSDDENADEIETYQNILSQKAKLEEYRDTIVSALERLKQGSYGVCDKCSKDIDEKRLRAFPSAIKCFECAS